MLFAGQMGDFGDFVNHGAKRCCKAWTKLLLGTVLSGFLIAGECAAADIPRPAASGQGNTGVTGSSVDKLLADAQTATRSGNFPLALILLKNAVRLAPSSGAAHMQLGLVLFRSNDLAGAEREMRVAWKGGAPEKAVLPFLLQFMLARREYAEILDQFPDPGSSNTPLAPDILKARAFALQRLGRAPEALDAVDRSLKLRRDGQGLLARANISLQQSDINSARKFADEAMESSPASIEIAIFKLGILKIFKDAAGAMALSNQLLAKFPDNLQVKSAHIEILLDQKQDAKAKAEVDGILAKQPKLYIAIYYKALLASRAGDARGAWDLAVTLPKEFLETSPVGLAVSQMAIDAGHQEAATNILGSVLAKNTDSLVARRRLASIYLDQNNPNSALTVLAPVKDSSDPAILSLLARIYTALDRSNDAQTVLKRLGATSEKSDVLQHALLEMRAGHTEQAIKELKEAAAKEPSSIAVARPLIGALVQAGRFPEALAVAVRLGQDSRQQATALVYRGEILTVQRKMPEAQIAFDKAIALEPSNQMARVARANFLIATQKYDDASKDLRAVISSDPKTVALRIRLADIAALQGKDQEARRVLGEAIAAFPQEALPRIALIRYLMAHKDDKTALKAADDLVHLQPANAEGVALRGQVQSMLKQKQEAVASFRRLVSLTPNAALSQLMLGNALFAIDDRAGAQSAVDAAAKLSPSSPIVKSAQINLQLVLGKADAAVSLARGFQASYPGSQADILVADTLTKAKRFDQASEVLAKSLAGKPNQFVLSRLVQLKILMNDKKAAANLMSQWLSHNPNDITVRQNFATFLMGENDRPGARVQYEAILKQDANNGPAMNNLGWLIQRSEPERALSLLTRASKLMPNSADVADTLGWFRLQQQKDAAGSLVLLQRAHTLNPRDGQITYHLAVALDANAKRAAARALLEPLLASGAKFEDLPDARRLVSAWR